MKITHYVNNNNIIKLCNSHQSPRILSPPLSAFFTSLRGKFCVLHFTSRQILRSPLHFEAHSAFSVSLRRTFLVLHLTSRHILRSPLPTRHISVFSTSLRVAYSNCEILLFFFALFLLGLTLQESSYFLSLAFKTFFLKTKIK